MMSFHPLSNYLDQAIPIDTKTFDLRFEEAVSLLEQDDFEQAISLIEEFFKEGCLDIRLIMQLFYAFFLKEGVMSFINICPSLQEVLTTYWEKLSPITMRESHTSKSIIWLFSILSKRMKRSSELHKEKRADALWSRTAECALEDLTMIENLLQDLNEFFINIWKLPSCQEHLRFILSWIEHVKQTIFSSPPSLKSLAKKEVLLVKEKPSPLPKEHKPPSSTSTNMELLTQKLYVFENLVKENEFQKASLVASDIQHTIENFNPVLFFPHLFSNYFSLLAKNIDTMILEWEQKGSPKWNALEKLYQTDIEAFVKW